jgi:hypothetical protein
MHVEMKVHRLFKQLPGLRILKFLFVTGTALITATGCTAAPAFIDPTATDNCGTPTILTGYPQTSAPTTLNCVITQTRTWVFVDDCGNQSLPFVQTVTTNMPDFVLPADGASTVNCPADATAPTPPTVVDACGNVITPVAGPAPSPATCEGDMVYTFTYTDCSGNSHVWTYTYTIDMPDFVLPADGASTVNCPADVVAPVAPVVVDACGNTITPVAGPAPSPATCEGDIVYTFTYTDCSGNSHVWTYTYTIDMPDFVLPADGASTVNCPADAVGTNTTFDC